MKRLKYISIDPWLLASLCIASAVLLPIAAIFLSSLTYEHDVWLHLKEHILSELLINTLMLSAGVLITTGVLGVSLGYITSMCDFPGRRFFSWSLLLPLAIPAYVMAFVYTGMLDYAGPVQTLLRSIAPGAAEHFPEIRSTYGVVLVMSLAFFPYVFMLSSSAFETLGESTVEAARSLGMGRKRIFLNVSLPMARPWIFAGLLLVLMETLADFGTVSIFNYNTFTTAIYKAWFGMFSIGTATRLSIVLIFIVLAVILVESVVRKNMKFYKSHRDRKRKRIKLTGYRAFMALGYVSFIFILSFLIPVFQLIIWAVEAFDVELSAVYYNLVENSFLLSCSGAALTIVLAIILSSNDRAHKNRLNRVVTSLSILGYALPGTVLAVGVVNVVSAIDHSFGFIGTFFGLKLSDQILQGAVITMIVSYAIRFMSAGFGAVNSNMQRITPSMDDAAKSMGAGRFKTLTAIHLPLIKSGMFTGLVLVFVEVMKEMPITLMTRPFGWDTLAVKIFELTSEGEWERAALPSIILIMAGLLPVFFITRQKDNS